jgi:transposase InsO family protein
VSRFQLIADHSAIFEVKRLCELVEVERSCFYAWKAAAPACQARAGADAELARGCLAGAIFHSGHRSVYTSKDYAGLCRDLGVVQSRQP